MHHLILDFRGLHDHRMIVRFRRRQVELVRGLYVRYLFEQGHKLRQLKNLRSEYGRDSPFPPGQALLPSASRQTYLPNIEVVEAVPLKREVLKIPLHV
jgi:hypothetical protein